VIEVAAAGTMLAAAWLAYGAPAGILEALAGGDETAWTVARSLGAYLGLALAAGWAVLRWSDAPAD